MLTIQPRMVSIFSARSPISSKHMMSFWCLFLDPHLTTYSSTIFIGVQIIVEFDLGMCILCKLGLPGDLLRSY